MKKEELAEIQNLKIEIEAIKKEIEDIEYEASKNTVTDTVRGSSRTFPYIQHTIRITGIDMKGYERKVRALKKQLEDRLNKLMDKIAEATEYIATVPDTETRIILQSKYVDGLTWEQIEERTGINIRTAQRKLKKFLSMNS